ncbi:hypothetical protein OF83DRAFT_1175434 [Amylostereum chailletii]|nr:hypothetical protein OF83DRAFT_1175434 [Amylostereum chailletii]
MQFTTLFSLLVIATTSSLAAPVDEARAVIPFTSGYDSIAKRDATIPFAGAYEDAEGEAERRSVIPFTTGYDVVNPGSAPAAGRKATIDSTEFPIYLS